MTKLRLYTAVISKEEALRLYRIEMLMYSGPGVSEAIPFGAEINMWKKATAVEAERRYNEIAISDEKEFSIEMFYDRPKDIINFNNRLSGDEQL